MIMGSHFPGGVSEQVNMQKGNSKGWYNERSLSFFISVVFKGPYVSC